MTTPPSAEGRRGGEPPSRSPSLSPVPPPTPFSSATAATGGPPGITTDAEALSALARALPPGRSLEAELRRAIGAGLALIAPADAEFPAPLHAIARPPPFLYRLGPVGCARPAIAIVGSRRASAAGERIAFRFGRELSERGWRVVSGLARGIDRAALDGAAIVGGEPWAVLGNGLPAIYPPEHRELAVRIVAAGGALFCELPCDAPPRRDHFPRRNRLISGLSLGVAVVEATERSGSLITAGWALDQGREVLAVPGPAEGPGHQGCHRLIREGATLVTSAEEVIEALSPEIDPPERIPAALRRAFLAGERDLAELLERTGLPPARLLEGWRRLLAEERGSAGLPPGTPPPSDPGAPDGSAPPS